jgi:kumamolisin
MTARVNITEARLGYQGARATGPADPEERMEVSVAVRRNNQAMLDDLTEKLAAGDRSQPPLTRDEFTRMFGATNADRALVKQFASANGLSVVTEDPARSTVHLSGTVAQMEKAFGVQMHQFAYPSGTYRGISTAASVPAALHGVVEAVLGLDTRPAARTHHRIHKMAQAPEVPGKLGARTAKTQLPYFSPDEFAALYNFPDSTGAGECVALIELGGGYMPSDNTNYFAQLGLQVPTIVPVSVNHAHNNPNGSDSGADGEVALDIQVVGALAQGAKIAVYFAPNTDQGFLNALNAAVYDSINRPSVISISWGAPEALWTRTAMQAMNRAMQAAVAMGITVFAAAGDNGSSDGMSDGLPHADFPSSSPYVVGCGGTMTQASGTQVARESVWNNMATEGGAAGGAVSAVFALPVYQKGLSVALTAGGAQPLTMRGAPDVTANADPNTGYLVMVNGQMNVIGGTSAVAPLMAALIARINAINGKPSGYIHAAIYKGVSSFVPITSGDNGAYKAATPWSAATGVGRPFGTKLQALLK